MVDKVSLNTVIYKSAYLVVAAVLVILTVSTAYAKDNRKSDKKMLDTPKSNKVCFNCPSSTFTRKGTHCVEPTDTESIAGAYQIGCKRLK